MVSGPQPGVILGSIPGQWQIMGGYIVGPVLLLPGPLKLIGIGIAAVMLGMLVAAALNRGVMVDYNGGGDFQPVDSPEIVDPPIIVDPPEKIQPIQLPFWLPPGKWPKDPWTGKYIPIDLNAPADPEDKFGPLGYDPQGTPTSELKRYVPQNQSFSYRIEFWNAENATAPVRDAYSYDQMDSNLDRSTFHFTEVGFMNWTIPLEPCQYFNVYVDPRPSMDVIVNIEGTYNEKTGTANWTYLTLDPVTLKIPEDPMVGFLPPITTSGSEIAWFSYEIDPNPNLATGTVIENRAWVNFDGFGPYNPAPKDYPYKNTIDAGKPTSLLSAEVTNTTEIHFSLSGNDDVGGSGLRDYTIYMSDNAGEYTPVLNNVNATTASIFGLSGHTYRFYSNARDNVGNRENPKASPDATVMIPVAIQIPVADFTANLTSGMAPLNVKFTYSSTGSPTEWDWNFGDGSAWVNGTEQTLSHTYYSVGNYTATLVVRNSAGQDQAQRMITVTKAIISFPGFTNPPTDPDNDGLYEDLNGNSRKDFNDVALMFNHMLWIPVNEPISAFDFNRNGRIDFNDIVMLFGEI
jgi:PKD repeat protein